MDVVPLVRYSDEVLAGVLELRRAGVPFGRIAERLELADETSARAAYHQALDESDSRFDVELEVQRLDRLLTVAWKRATATPPDLAAMDRVLKIGERRERLLAHPRQVKHELREAFDDSAIAASGYDADLDAALLAAGRAIADRIDAAMCGDDHTETTKALYMVPHLVNILREMGATPKARLEEAVASANAGRVPASGEVRGGGTAARRQRAAQRRVFGQQSA